MRWGGTTAWPGPAASLRLSLPGVGLALARRTCWVPGAHGRAFAFCTRLKTHKFVIPFPKITRNHHKTIRSSGEEPGVCWLSLALPPAPIHSRFRRVPQCLLLSVAVPLAPRDRARDPDRGKTARGRPPTSRSSGLWPVPKPSAPVAIKRSRTTRQRGTART